MDILKRIMRKSKANGDCLEWQGHRTLDGYGMVKINGTSCLVHRVVWENKNGEIPDGMYVCHMCDNPPCFKLSRLFLGTPSDNQKDSYNKDRHPIISNKGERNGRSILTEGDIGLLRHTWNNNKFGYGEKKKFYKKHSDIYGVSTSAIKKVVKNHSWKYLERESE